MQYEYDTYGNLTGREDGYWGMTEDFGYDNLNRLVSTPAGDITYDGKGNITEHDAAGVFGYASSRPYAVDQIALSVSDFPTANQTISFNSMNRPDTIGEGSTTAVLKYFEDGERSQMSVLKNSGCFIRNYFGNQFTTTDYTTQSYEGQKQVLFLGGDAYTAPAALVREKENGTNVWSQSLYYIVRDNLGSIVHIVDSTGVIAQELSYDAWGRLRDPNTQQIYAPGEQPELLLDRGYCGHEHLADFNLINMNARLYDPWTARFLSPDPYVQLPDFTQSLNRYSYCLNNPLKLMDIDGKKFDYSGMSGSEYAQYMADISALLTNKMFEYYYDKLKESNQVYHVRFDKNGEYFEDYKNADGLYFPDSNTLLLGGSYTHWTISEELYHAYQHNENQTSKTYNLEMEANFVAFLVLEGRGAPVYNSFKGRNLDYLDFKYGDSLKKDYITFDKINVIMKDYLEIGQSFIFDRPNIEGYTIPVTNFPELLLNLLNEVYK